MTVTRRPLARILAAALVVPTLAALPSTTSGAAARLCLGEPATKVGRPGGTLVGTERPDVLVSNGATRVRALGGVDRICITGSRGQRVSVSAGAGADRVVVRVEGSARIVADLGGGRDLYQGGAGIDRVSAGVDDFDDIGPGTDDLADTIRTGPGDDSVVAGGRRGLRDRIDLGPGDDLLRLRSDPTIASAPSTGVVEAGTGRDQVDFAGRIAGNVHLDASQGQVTSGSLTTMYLWSLEDFRLRTSTDAAVRFTGTRAGETLDVLAVGSLDARLGRGNDAVGVRVLSSATSRLEGGLGTDAMSLGGKYADSIVDIDAASGTASTTPGGSDHVAIAGFESLSGRGETVTVQGSADPESIAAYGCDLTVRGGGGADGVLVYGEFTGDDVSCDVESHRAEGEGGDDVLTGSRADDVLVGGPGTDRADGGGGGEDVCDAETVVRCG